MTWMLFVVVSGYSQVEGMYSTEEKCHEAKQVVVLRLKEDARLACVRVTRIQSI